VTVSKKAPTVDVAWARLDAPCAAIEALAGCLSDRERRRAARLSASRERRRFIVARARLREELAARLGTGPAQVEFAYGARGKPALAAPWSASGWRFNVAHCGSLALYAFSREGEVGVDVEAVREVPEAAAIAARFFSPAERDHVLEAPPAGRAHAFLRLWTRKEALVKALGEGLAAPLHELDVSAAPAGWRIESFSPRPGFIAALALSQS
jgi:4'-phosphopantetheinyl transferase